MPSIDAKQEAKWEERGVYGGATQEWMLTPTVLQASVAKANAANRYFPMSCKPTRIWTFCSQLTFQELNKQGELYVDEKLIDPDDMPAYRWMTAQLNDKVGTKVKAPWWGWHSWGKRNGRPDLRCSGHMPRGTKSQLLELLLDPNEILLSQFEMWLRVLDGNIVVDCVADEPYFSLGLMKMVYPQGHKPFSKKNQATWKRIFDLTFGSVEHWGAHADRWIQACFPLLRLSDIASAQPFVAR